MRKIAIWILLLCTTQQAISREVINLNKDWKFFTSSQPNSDEAQVIHLPHMWNADALTGNINYFRGIGNYMKEIHIPKEWQGQKQIYIRFLGAGSVASLMLNGRYVGEHKGGYTAFVFDLTDQLKYGETNAIWVKVNNASRQDVLPTAGDLNIYGGLYRDVQLIVTEKAHIAVNDYASEGVYLHQRKVLNEEAEVEAVVELEAPEGKLLTVTVCVQSPQKDTVVLQNTDVRIAGRGGDAVSVPIKIKNPTLWDGINNPFIYNVRVTLTDAGKICDEVEVPLGLRYYSIDPKQGFMLNGKPYRLKGVVHYEDRATVGLALRPYQIKEDLDLICDMGANAVRAAGFQHNSLFYQECDRRGILVWAEIPLIGPAFMSDRGFIPADDFQTNGIKQLYETIFQLFNHPSVILWGLFSNLDVRGDSPADYIKTLNTISLQEDPSRMTVATSNQDGNINMVTDLIVFDLQYGWREGTPSDLKIWLNQLKKSWGSLSTGISYGAGASIFQQSDSLVRPDYLGNWHPERWQTFIHEQYFPIVNEAPYLWGWFVSNMFDYGAAKRHWGDGTGVNDRGLGTFDRKYLKDAFFFYQANWNKEKPMIHIAEKRWTPREKSKQNLKVYTNANEAEMVVNGVSIGTKNPVNGTCIWENVSLLRGNNTIEARSSAGNDRAEIEIL